VYEYKQRENNINTFKNRGGFFILNLIGYLTGVENNTGKKANYFYLDNRFHGSLRDIAYSACK